jgi:glycerate dehydrogenase
MERVVFLDRKTIRVPVRPPRFAHEWHEYDTSRKEDVPARLRDATIAITNKVPLRAAELAGLRSLRLIAVAATGVDVVDLDYCRQAGITVCNVPHYAVHSVPEHVFLLILSLRKNLVNLRSALQAGMWEKSGMFSLLDYPLHDIAGSTLGIIGYGELGRAVEKRARAFEMNVLIAERKHAPHIRPGRTAFEEVLAQSDVVTVHCPLTPATRQLIGSTELTRMKPTALLINAARGGIVDEEALANALRYKLLGGAGLDVLRDEPPPPDHPLMKLSLPNLIITPHVGWASVEAVTTLAEKVIQNMEFFVAGEPKNVIS